MALDGLAVFKSNLHDAWSLFTYIINLSLEFRKSLWCYICPALVIFKRKPRYLYILLIPIIMELSYYIFNKLTVYNAMKESYEYYNFYLMQILSDLEDRMKILCHKI